MARVFTSEARMGLWLAVERAALAALVAADVAPREACDALAAVTEVDVEAVAAREAEIHHDLAAFVDVVGEQAPGAAAWLHYGLTSSDVVDTALGLQIQVAGELLMTTFGAAKAAVAARVHEHAGTVMLGRTHGMPAELTTFGAKLAGWWHQMDRDERRLLDALAGAGVGKLSGSVGTYPALDPAIEKAVLDTLGLGRDPSATQVVQRDRLAALIGVMAVCASSLDRFCTEIRHLQRGEVAEVAEPFAAAQKGSSAMPHKRNPIISERVCGLSRVVRSHAIVALENVALWHERDISHSSAERIIVPDAFLALDYMLDRFCHIMRGLNVDADRMRANVDAQRGLIFSQHALLALARQGVSRDEAYRIVQTAASAVNDGEHASLADGMRAQIKLADRRVDIDTVLASMDERNALRNVSTLMAGVPRSG